jgi:hypothetical protein
LVLARESKSFPVTIDLGHLKDGLYFANIISGGTSKVVKVMKR